MSPEGDESFQSPTLATAVKDVGTTAVQWSPRFEFDAPRYVNFSRRKYRQTRRQLNRLVLQQDCDSSDDTADSQPDPGRSDVTKGAGMATVSADDDLSIMDLDMFSAAAGRLSDSGSDSCDDWFQRFHPLHEPLRPHTPPGPLIGPDDGRRLMDGSPVSSSPVARGRVGLSARPARVLRGRTAAQRDGSVSPLRHCHYEHEGRTSSTRVSTDSHARDDSFHQHLQSSRKMAQPRTSPPRSPGRPQRLLPVELDFWNVLPEDTHSSEDTRSSKDTHSSDHDDLRQTMQQQLRIRSGPASADFGSVAKRIRTDKDAPSPLAMVTVAVENDNKHMMHSVISKEHATCSTTASRHASRFAGNPPARLNTIGLSRPAVTTHAPRGKPRQHKEELDDIKRLLSQHNRRLRPNNKE